MTVEKKKRDHLGPFHFHGVDFKELSDKQAKGDCPLCGKEGHFFANPKTGQWDCKSCGQSGNAYTFLSAYYKVCEGSTTKQNLTALAQRRRLPVAAFTGMNGETPAFDGDRWLFPVYGEANPDSFVNLHAWKEGTSLLGTEDCSLHMIHGHRLPGSGPIYVCEGFWDTYAFDWLVKRVKVPGVVVGVPGASTFKREWLPHFKGREVYLLYDNDNAGANGMGRAAELLKGTAASVVPIRWPADLRDGYDINDFVSDNVAAPAKAWKILQAMLTASPSSPEKGPAKRKGKPPAFQTVLKTFKKDLHLDKNMENALAVMFAVSLSTQLPGDPLWLFLVGPPGSGKTLLLRGFEGSESCIFQSSLTAHSLVSGFRPPGEGEEDPSLIAQLSNKCLVLKDYTEVKSMPAVAQEEIYGTLRGAYDGKVERIYGNGIKRIYDNTHFSMIAGVTDIIHGDQRATLGERFLKFEFIRGAYTQEQADRHIRAALKGMDKLLGVEVKLRDVCGAFLDQEVKKFPEVPEWALTRLVSLSQIIGYLRAGVARDYSGELSYRSRSEVGTRLAKQLAKLARALAVVYGKRTIDAQIYQIIEQVAFDTAIGWHLDIVQSMLPHAGKPITREELADLADVPLTSLQRKLDNLQELGIVKREKLKASGSKKIGRPAYGYVLSHNIASLWKKAKVGQKGTR